MLNTNLKKYGVEHSSQLNIYKEKQKETNLKKYGKLSPLLNCKIKEKTKETNLRKFGFIHQNKNEKIKDKIKKTKNIKYDDETFNNRNKAILTNLKKYGVKNPSMNNKIKNKILKSKEITLKNSDKNILTVSFINKKITMICKNNHIFNIDISLYKNRKRINTEICTICNPLNSTKSGMEIQLIDFIKENYIGNILKNKRNIINPLELDIYIPELKLAFEFNGLYWHNEEHKPNNYHLNKTEECEKQEIHLIHIYEDDWIYKQDIVKSMILNKLNLTPNKIGARKTKVKEITDNKLIREFLETNHLQGFVGSKIKLGLFIENELVSLMTFGKRRVAMGKKYTNEGEWELLRFCNKLNTNVIGGASKLFKYFMKNYKPKEIVTYADRSHSNGGLYEQLGFNFIGKTKPNYYYIIDGIRHHRFNYRKDKLIKEGFNFNKTEHEIMIERNIFRIYDSGNLKYILYDPSKKTTASLVL